MFNYLTNTARLALAVFILMAALLVAPQSVQAQEIITDGRVPAGTVVENDTFIFGGDVVVDGDVDGDLFAFGSHVCDGADPSGFRLVTRFPRRVFQLEGSFAPNATLESAGIGQGQEMFMVEMT